jgi:hypothetical protein
MTITTKEQTIALLITYKNFIANIIENLELEENIAADDAINIFSNIEDRAKDLYDQFNLKMILS